MATSRIQPPMDHERDAKALTQRLLQNIGEGERKYVSEPLDIFAADVEAAVERFDVQLQFSFRSQAGFPFVRIVELVPMDWGGFLPLPWVDLWSRAQEHAVELFYLLEDTWRLWRLTPLFSGFERVETVLVNSREAVSLFGQGLTRFLTVRFSARQSDISTNPGLPFRVITQTSGLRVHWSPAYFFNPNNVFGSPTSPVDAWIQPGKYMFGAVGPNFPLQFDPATFDIPPLTQANLVSI